MGFSSLVSVVPFPRGKCQALRVARSNPVNIEGPLIVAAEIQIEIPNEIFNRCHSYSKPFRLACSFIFYDRGWSTWNEYLSTLRRRTITPAVNIFLTFFFLYLFTCLTSDLIKTGLENNCGIDFGPRNTCSGLIFLITSLQRIEISVDYIPS